MIGEMVYFKSKPATGSSISTKKKHESSLSADEVISKNGSIAIITQTAHLINATIKDNILFGSPYDETRYRHTLKICQLLPDLITFKGFDLEEVGERGINLSGGQK